MKREPRPRPTLESSLTSNQSVILCLESSSSLADFPIQSERDHPVLILGCHLPLSVPRPWPSSQSRTCLCHCCDQAPPPLCWLVVTACPLQSGHGFCRNHGLATDKHAPGGDQALQKVRTFLQAGDTDPLAPWKADAYRTVSRCVPDARQRTPRLLSPSGLRA